MPNKNLHNENKLIEDNYKLVWSIVNKFHYLKEEKDDLFQSGCIGLIMAAKKFDVSRGNAFSTFAVPYILGEIKNYLRNKNHIKVSKKILSMQRKINQVIEIDGNLSINDIARKLDLPYEDVVMSYNHNNKALSLESSIYDDNRVSLIDMKTVDNRYDIDKSSLEIKDIIKQFSKIEKKLMFYRFYYGFNQNEIAAQLKISQSKVSRLEKKITEEFKKYYMIK
ncbi:sigma-70 family RNA polymerase sigma factor [Mycoplasmatota bacterium]|nr:sigma-70 family RNA polymerase sigma factor [Mycoplasmatota bacterium]